MSRIQRLIDITRIASRYRLDTLIEPAQLPWSLRLLLRLGPWRLSSVPAIDRGERIRLALEQLGPIFIKFGQMLSTRRDLLPADIIDQLAKLQDQVPPFAESEAIAIIEQSLGQSIAELFSEFSSTPLASASVAQVHAATLHSGETVVVKVVRPGIEKTIHQDTALLSTVARLLEKHLPEARRLRPVDVVEDYRHTIIDELDLQREAANGSQLRRNFEHSPLLYVPEVYWDYSRRNVLTTERIHGIPVTDVTALNRQNTNMKLLAERGVEIFFTQVFRDSFFHADMHPGNVFVSTEHPQTPQYIAIDCAIIGTLSESDQYYLARNLLAIFQRDYRQVAQLHIECGWIPAHTRANDFEAAIRSVCEPIFGKPLGEISFAQLLIYLFQTARRFEMEVQPSLVLLQKTLLHIEGLGRDLYPELDLWSTAQPFLERWIKQRYSPRGTYQRAQQQLPALLEQLPKLPEILLQSLSERRSSPPNQNSDSVQLARLQAQLHQRQRRKNVLTLAAVLLMAAAVVANPSWLEPLRQIPPLSWLLLTAAAIALLRR